MGVRSVINLRAAHSDRAQMRAAGVGLRYHHVSFKPWHPEDEDVIEFLRILADPANLPAFVHCQHGADRTGTMVAIYRIVAEGWTVEEALAEMTGGGFGFHRVWRGLKTYLRQMDAEALAVKAGLRETEEDR
jgi:protein tyrosine/serine phosphatase